MALLEDIIKKIEEYDTIIIHGHQHPDGDCLGSQIGLKDIIETTYSNKNAYVVGEDSEYLEFLGSTDKVTDDLYKDALVIIVDLANSERCSDQRYKLAKFTCRIDHHVKVEEFCDLEYIDDTSPSCAEIIARIVFDYNHKITLKGAKALYTGVVTDTGRFRFDSVKSKTHYTTAKLLEFGINPAEIDNFLSVDTVETLKLKGYVLSNFRVTEEGFAYIAMTRDVIEKYNVSDEQAANMVTLLGTLKGVLTWALFIEYADKSLKIRIRSKGPKINDFASLYGGGGHPKAAGAKMNSWDDMNRFINDMNKFLVDYKNNK